MLIYTSIFITSLILALVARVFLKRASSKSVSQQGSTKKIANSGRSRVYKEREAEHITGKGALVPSGEVYRLTEWNLEKTHPASPSVCRKRDTSWLLREKKLVSTGVTYKVRRRVEPTPPTLDMVSKPFRQKIASWAHNEKIAIRPWKD